MKRFLHDPAALAVVISAALLAGSATAAATPPTQPLPGASQGRCPKLAMQRLDADAVARATSAALAEAHAVYRGTNLKGMLVTKAVLARLDPARGGYARVKCGARARARTVVVYVEFPAMRPSASLSQGVVLVAKFAGTYRVWARLH